MPERQIPKLYYSIGQVSRLTGVESHVLRYWESEFRELSPRKNRSGKRQYRERDLAVVGQIKRLLYDDGYTIKGARRELANWLEQEKAEKAGDKAVNAADDMLQRLVTIKHSLEDIRRMLDS